MTIDQNASKVISLSWQDIHEATTRLAAALAEKGPFKGIVAVTRGGLVPAAIVARIMDIRLIETVCIRSYGDDNAQGSMVILKEAACVRDDGEGWLVVDDLVDSGATAKEVHRMMPKAVYATVYAKPKGHPEADVTIIEVQQDTWLVFPWDLDPPTDF